MDNNKKRKQRCNCDSCICAGMLVAWLEGYYTAKYPGMDIPHAAMVDPPEGAEALHNSPMIEMISEVYGPITLLAALAKLAMWAGSDGPQEECDRVADPNDKDTERLRKMFGES